MSIAAPVEASRNIAGIVAATLLFAVLAVLLDGPLWLVKLVPTQDGPVHLAQADLIIVAVLGEIQIAFEGADHLFGERGRIHVSLAQDSLRTVLTVEDNGIGLPQDGRDRLTEPYVTTRTKGTGLGLAIVKKIMEDHAGELVLGDGAVSAARRPGVSLYRLRPGLGGRPRKPHLGTAVPQDPEPGQRDQAARTMRTRLGPAVTLQDHLSRQKVLVNPIKAG